MIRKHFFPAITLLAILAIGGCAKSADQNRLDAGMSNNSYTEQSAKATLTIRPSGDALQGGAATKSKPL